jgi:hypothetical protein
MRGYWDRDWGRWLDSDDGLPRIEAYSWQRDPELGNPKAVGAYRGPPGGALCYSDFLGPRGRRRFGGPFLLDPFKHFFPVYRDRLRGVDTDSHLVAVLREDLNPHVGSNANRFTDPACEYEHDRGPRGSKCLPIVDKNAGCEQTYAAPVLFCHVEFS